MNAKQTHFLLIGLLGLAIVGILAGSYGVNSFLGGKAAQLAGLKGQAASLQTQTASLKKAKQDIAKYSDVEQIAQQIVPQDKDQAAAVQQIVNIAGNAGVTLTNITFPSSTLGGPVVGGSAAGGVGAAKGQSPAAAATAKSALSQLTPVTNIPGVYQLQITIQNDNNNPTTYPQFYQMLSALEQNRRTAQVSNIEIQPDSKNPNIITFVLTLNEYIKPS